MSRHKCDWSELIADVYWQTARSGSEISNHQERIIKRAKYDFGWWQCWLWLIRIMMFGCGNGIITLITYLWNINWYIHENEDSDCATWEEACEGSNDVPTGCEKNEREEDAEATPPHLNGKRKSNIRSILSCQFLLSHTYGACGEEILRFDSPPFAANLRFCPDTRCSCFLTHISFVCTSLVWVVYVLSGSPTLQWVGKSD